MIFTSLVAAVCTDETHAGYLATSFILRTRIRRLVTSIKDQSHWSTGHWPYPVHGGAYSFGETMKNRTRCMLPKRSHCDCTLRREAASSGSGDGISSARERKADIYLSIDGLCGFCTSLWSRCTPRHRASCVYDGSQIDCIRTGSSWVRSSQRSLLRASHALRFTCRGRAGGE